MAQIGEILRKKIKKCSGNCEDYEPHIKQSIYLANARTGYYLFAGQKIGLDILIDALRERHGFSTIGSSFGNIFSLSDLQCLPAETMCVISKIFRKEWKEEEILVVKIDPRSKKIYVLSADPLCEDKKEYREKCKRVTNMIVNAASKVEYRFGEYDVQYIVCPQYFLRKYLERFETHFEDPLLRRMTLISNLMAS